MRRCLKLLPDFLLIHPSHTFLFTAPALPPGSSRKSGSQHWTASNTSPVYRHHMRKLPHVLARLARAYGGPRMALVETLSSSTKMRTTEGGS